MVQEPRPAGDHRREHDDRRGANDPVLDGPAVLECRQGGEDVERRQQALSEREDEDAQGERHVDERQDDVRRDHRRVRAARDRAVGEHNPHGVPGPRRDDGIDADARDVCRENRRPAHGAVRIRGGEDVPPRAARAAELEELADDRGEQRQDRDVREEVPEALARGADLVDHAVKVTGS